MEPSELQDLIGKTIVQEVRSSPTVTPYREPIVGLVAADDPAFARLSEWTGNDHMTPADLLPGARTVVSFFLPFTPEIVSANAQKREEVARSWAVAYVETNALIGQITARLIEVLGRHGIRAAAEPATKNFDHVSLRGRWSHKSIAVLAGIGSLGLHNLVITDAGCAGRFGSLVMDAGLSVVKPEPKERCDYYASGACMDCALACPVDAIDAAQPFDRKACWAQLLQVASGFLDLGDDVHICGKCAVAGPCALAPAV